MSQTLPSPGQCHGQAQTHWIATVHNKAAIIRKTVGISQFEPCWLMNDHPAMQVMQGLVGQFLTAALSELDEDDELLN